MSTSSHIARVLTVVLVSAAPLFAAHDDKGPWSPSQVALLADAESPQDLAVGSVTLCVGGMAGSYPCSKVDLESFLPLASIGGGAGNDIWGWTGCGGREFALMGRSSGTSFVEITDPANPVYLGNLPTHTSNSTWRDVKTYADHAFIVSEASGHGLQIFDLTGLCAIPNPPVTFSETAHYNGFGNAHNIAINEDTGYAYAVGTSTCSGGLHMINIQNPTSPTEAGCFSNDGYTHDAQCVVYHGPDVDYVGEEICFASNEDTLTIVDVTNKGTPVQLSRTGYTGAGYTNQGWLTEDHGYLLLTDELDELNNGHNTRTRVWDVSDLDVPVLIGSYDASTAAIDHAVFVKGSYAYEANYRAGFRVLRLDDLASASLSEVAFFDIYPASDSAGFNGAWSTYPFYSSGVVVVSGIEQGLFVLRPRLAPEFDLTVADSMVSVCQPGGAATTVTVAAFNGYGGSVTLTTSGVPTGGQTALSPEVVAAPGSSSLSFSASGVTPGIYLVTVTGDDGSLSRDVKVDLAISDGATTAPDLLAPADGELEVSVLPTFSWNPVDGAVNYLLEVATDSSFGSLVLSETVTATTSFAPPLPLASELAHFWRVTAQSACTPEVSPIFTFTTVRVSCESVAGTGLLVPIGPDAGSVTVSILDFPTSGAVVDVNVVGLVGTHTFIRDLDFNLTDPAMTTTEIMSRSCSDHDNFDINLDDQAAAGPWPCPPTDGGTYRPSNPLAIFNGAEALGTWTLTIRDNADQDGGALDAWGLEICYETPTTPPGLIFMDGFESGDLAGWSFAGPAVPP